MKNNCLTLKSLVVSKRKHVSEEIITHELNKIDSCCCFLFCFLMLKLEKQLSDSFVVSKRSMFQKRSLLTSYTKSTLVVVFV